MPTSVRLSPDIERRLGVIAARTHRSKSFYIRSLIEHGLEDIEDYYAAEEVMKRVRSGEEELIDIEDVMKELGISKDEVMTDVE